MKTNNLTRAVRRISGLLIGCCMACHTLPAQDAKPVQAAPDFHSVPVYPSKELRQLMRFVPLDNSMPRTFRDTLDNRIIDPTGSLDGLFREMGKMDRPLRIVHIGDSHVRGHVFPYVVRRRLEEDFGREAVRPLPVTYQTTGIASETGAPGIVYHMLGVNGATYATYAASSRMQEVIALKPDLVIVSFGTNEAHARGYSAEEHRRQMDSLLKAIRKACPTTAFLLTTPPGAYVRNGKKGRTPNPRTELVVATELAYAQREGMAVWDLYHIVGGRKSACRNWMATNYFRRDRIHFTHEGYTLQGLLLHEALIKAYNDYVATGLE